MTKNRPVRLTVLRTEQIAPSIRRVVFGGERFDEFAERLVDFTDRYVKLVFLAEGHEYPDPLDLEEIRATMPPEAWPVLRTYTVRSVDHEAREVAIDFVVHGDEGIAGPWASTAQPGDELHLRGPSGAYAPDPAADWHLLVGDESALPAIGAALESLPADSRAIAFIEVDGPGDEIALRSAADVDVRWLHRGGAARGSTTLLDDAVRAWPWPGGRVQVFVHGESALLKTVRPYLVKERAVARADVSVSAYWRRGVTEEGFRQWKSAQDDAVMRPGT